MLNPNEHDESLATRHALMLFRIGMHLCVPVYRAGGCCRAAAPIRSHSARDQRPPRAVRRARGHR